MYDKKLAAYAEKHYAYVRQLDLCARYFCAGRINAEVNARLHKSILNGMDRVWKNAQAYARRHGISAEEMRAYQWH